MIRDTNPFQEGMIERIYYCSGRTYKTLAGAKRNNPNLDIYLVRMTYEKVEPWDE